MIRYATLPTCTFHVRETAHVYSASVPDPNPVADVDALEALEEEIVLLAAHLHAAEHRFLTLVAEFDRRQGWKLAGHRSCAHWLAFRCGYDLGTARERVRAARALVKLPETSAAMSRGELSFSKVRALSRVATPENEGDLLDLARGSTTAQLERMVRGFKLGSRQEKWIGRRNAMRAELLDLPGRGRHVRGEGTPHTRGRSPSNASRRGSRRRPLP